jgi:hypothetical protein
MRRKRPLNRRFLILMFAILIGSGFIFVIRPILVKAITKTFTQSDWSGGADINATNNDNNLTDWNKYYSKDSTINTDTLGEIKLNLN